MKYDLIFISTCQDHALAKQLAQSIVTHNEQLLIHLVMINQVGELHLTGNEHVRISIVNTRQKMSLSKARNRAMTEIAMHNLQSDFVFYPDDDTSFDDVFFRDFKKHITDPHQAYMIRVLNEDDHREYKNFYLRDGQILRKKDAGLAISYNIIIPYQLSLEVGKFDEKLGVGAEFGSSEDLDYFIRCQKRQSFRFVRQLYCFHPSRDGKYRQMSISQIKKRFEKYSEGYLFVMYRYKFWYKVLMLPFRSLGGVALNLLKMRLSWSWAYLALFFKRWEMIIRFTRKKITKPSYFA